MQTKAYQIGTIAPLMHMLIQKERLGVISDFHIEIGDKLALKISKFECLLYTVTKVISKNTPRGNYAKLGFSQAQYYMMKVEMETTFLSKVEIIEPTHTKEIA